MGNYNTRDGPMNVNGGNGPNPNYQPNRWGTPENAGSAYKWHGETFKDATIGRYEHQHPNTNYEQPRELWNRVFNDVDRDAVIANISGFLGKCTQDIKERQCKEFYKVDPVYGERVAKGVGVDLNKAKM